MIQLSKYNQIVTLFAVLILTNNNLRGCCYRAKRHCWGGESCGLAKQGGRTSSIIHTQFILHILLPCATYITCTPLTSVTRKLLCILLIFLIQYTAFRTSPQVQYGLPRLVVGDNGERDDIVLVSVVHGAVLPRTGAKAVRTSSMVS